MEAIPQDIFDAHIFTKLNNSNVLKLRLVCKNTMKKARKLFNDIKSKSLYSNQAHIIRSSIPFSKGLVVPDNEDQLVIFMNRVKSCLITELWRKIYPEYSKQCMRNFINCMDTKVRLISGKIVMPMGNSFWGGPKKLRGILKALVPEALEYIVTIVNNEENLPLYFPVRHTTNKFYIECQAISRENMELALERQYARVMAKNFAEIQRMKDSMFGIITKS